MLTSKFNQGKLTSTDIDREFNDEFVSKAIVEMAPRKRFFTGRGSRVDMPKHYGDQLTKIIQMPMLHKDNMNDAGLDASTAEIITNTWYVLTVPSYDAQGNLIPAEVTGEFAADDYIGTGTVTGTGAPGDPYVAEQLPLGFASDPLTPGVPTVGSAIEAAMFAAAVAAGQLGTVAGVQAGIDAGTIKAGAGRIQWGDASFNVSEGPLHEIPEEGGILNLLNATTRLVSAKITFHGIATRYTVRSQDLGSLPGQIGRKIKELSKAKSDLQEMQIQNSLLAQAETNSMVSGDVHSNMHSMTPFDVVTYDDLTQFEQSLMGDDLPLDTEILSGVNLTDTRTVEDAYIVYINRELVPALRKMTGPGGVNVWVAKSKYAAGTKLLDGEVGMVDGLAFRFIVVPDLQKYQGAGMPTTATTGEAVDWTGDPLATNLTYNAAASATHSSGTNIDVFAMLVIGDDSFVTTSLTGSNTKAKHIMPKADVHNDMYGEVGGVSTKWTYGFLCYREERISALYSVAPRV